VTSNPPTLTVAHGSSAGQKRALNEDAVLARSPVFVVADGMGGHDAGDRASAIAVAKMSQLPDYPSVEEVHEALTSARIEIDELVARDITRSAGTTISGLVLVEQADQPYWLVLNLGDSRTYRVTNGVVHQISVDHSEVQELIEAGDLDAESALAYDRRHVVTRVLGARTVERPDYWLIPVHNGERWLVCSDGLTEEVSDEFITEILTSSPTAHDAANALVDSALTAGGHDNISVIVIDVAGADDDEVTIGSVLWPDLSGIEV